MGDKILNGGGLEVANGMAGVIQGGGRWPARLSMSCHEMMGQLGEDEIYALYRELPSKTVVRSPVQ